MSRFNVRKRKEFITGDEYYEVEKQHYDSSIGDVFQFSIGFVPIAIALLGPFLVWRTILVSEDKIVSIIAVITMTIIVLLVQPLIFRKNIKHRIILSTIAGTTISTIFFLILNFLFPSLEIGGFDPFSIFVLALIFYFLSAIPGIIIGFIVEFYKMLKYKKAQKN